MALPLGLTWDRADNLWASQLNPVINNSLNNVVILKNIVLKSGTNVINHGLQQMQQGWIILDIQGAAVVYRNAPFNTTTLSLSSSAAVTLTLGVY